MPPTESHQRHLLLYLKLLYIDNNLIGAIRLEVGIVNKYEVLVKSHIPLLTLCQSRIGEALGEEVAEWQVEHVLLLKLIALHTLQREVLVSGNGYDILVAISA